MAASLLKILSSLFLLLNFWSYQDGLFSRRLLVWHEWNVFFSDIQQDHHIVFFKILFTLHLNGWSYQDDVFAERLLMTPLLVLNENGVTQNPCCCHRKYIENFYTLFPSIKSYRHFLGLKMFYDVWLNLELLLSGRSYQHGVLLKDFL